MVRKNEVQWQFHTGNSDEKEEYAAHTSTEKAAHRLEGRQEEGLRKVAFELKG